MTIHRTDRRLLSLLRAKEPDPRPAQRVITRATGGATAAAAVGTSVFVARDRLAPVALRGPPLDRPPSDPADAYFTVKSDGRHGAPVIDPARRDRLVKLRNAVELGTASAEEVSLWSAVSARAAELGVVGFDEQTRVDPTRPGADAITATVEAVNASGDVSQLDRIDNFRSRLTPEQQQQYDAMLAQLRSDPRIQFEYRGGAAEDPALEDLALRGMVAANFNDPSLLDQVLNQSVEKDGELSVLIYSDSVPLGDFYPGNTGTAAGLATPDNDIAIDASDFYAFLSSGDNALVHEFSHLQQRVREDGSAEPGRVPGDFPYPDAFADAFAAPEFQSFLVDHFLGGKPPKEGELALGDAESWPTVQNLFHQDPEALKKASPELYELMSRYTGLDPLGHRQAPPVQLNGKGDAAAATQALLESYDSVAGSDGVLDAADLQRVLHDSSAAPEVQAAAALLLSSPVWSNALDVGLGKGSVDGKISRGDLAAAANAVAELPEAGPAACPASRDEANRIVDQYLLLADTAAGREGRDHHVSRDDLQALVDDPGTPAPLRAAAEYLLGE